MEKIDYKGYSITIEQDDCPESPRDWDNLGKMVCFHKRYDLGDKTDLKYDMFDGWEELAEHLKEEGGAAIILPLFLYDHSGVSIRVGPWAGKAQHAQWDSGQVGFVYVSKETLLKEYSVKKLDKKTLEAAEKVLRSEVEVYNQYLEGDVYFYSITKDGENVDSLSGIYGYDETEKEAKEVVDSHIVGDT